MIGSLIESVMYSALYADSNNPELDSVLSYLVAQMSRKTGQSPSQVLTTAARQLVFSGNGPSRFTEWELEYGKPKVAAFHHAFKALLYQPAFPPTFFAEGNVPATLYKWSSLRENLELELAGLILNHPKIREAGIKDIAPKYAQAIRGLFQIDQDAIDRLTLRLKEITDSP